MKKVLSIILILTMCLSMAACGDSGKKELDLDTKYREEKPSVDETPQPEPGGYDFSPYIGSWYNRDNASESFVVEENGSWTMYEDGNALYNGHLEDMDDGLWAYIEQSGDYSRVYMQPDGLLELGGYGYYQFGGAPEDRGPIDSSYDTSCNNDIAGRWIHSHDGTEFSFDGTNFQWYNQGEISEGPYAFDGTDLYLFYMGELNYGWMDDSGDLVFANWDGWYSPAGDDEPAIHDPGETDITMINQPVYISYDLSGSYDLLYNDDGTCTLYDYDYDVSTTFPDWMNASNTFLSGALLVGDGTTGFVITRNVNTEFFNYTGSAEDFVTDYIYSVVLEDFAALYGECSYMGDITINNNPSARNGLVHAKFPVSNDSYDMYANVLISSLTADGGDLIVVARVCFVERSNEDQLVYLKKILSGTVNYSFG